MDQNSLPTLLELAAQSLMSNESAGIQALEVLPKHLFIQLFTTAFLGRQKKMLKAIVKVWPFQCLHIGKLTAEESPYDILRVLVDGIQFLPAQNTSSSGSKLRILDLRQAVDCEITCYYRAEYPSCFQSCVYSQHSILKVEASQHIDRCLEMGAPASVPVPVRKPVEILLNISFSCTVRTKRFIYFLKNKVDQSSGSLHLCCRNLQIENICMHTKSLRVLDQACIDQLEVNRVHLRNITTLFPQLLHLGSLKLSALPFQSCEGRNFKLFLTWLGKLDNLQDLCLSSFGFTDHLHRLLRVLKPQLTTLSLSLCRLSNRDITDLYQSSHITHLKRLNLSNNNMLRDNHEPFLTLLGRVSSTLQHLEINNCKINDSVLSALLPALSRCSHLRVFSFALNSISMPVLTNFLQHLTSWVSLRDVIYPIPIHCYEQGNFEVILNQQKLTEVQDQFKLMLKEAKREDMRWSTSE